MVLMHSATSPRVRFRIGDSQYDMPRIIFAEQFAVGDASLSERATASHKNLGGRDRYQEYLGAHYTSIRARYSAVFPVDYPSRTWGGHFSSRQCHRGPTN